MTTTQARKTAASPGASTESPPDQRPDLIAQAASGYDRQISGLLVRCCDLAVEQYQLSRTNDSFDGSIRALEAYPDYAALLDRYTQVASFRAAEIDLSDAATTPNIATKNNSVAISIKEIFFGYALTSPTSNIIALRGTQTDAEWVNNIAARQANFVTRQPQYGKVHVGFQLSYEKVITQIRRTIEQFNPAVPCYITGHSLGSAVAILTAANLAFDTALKSQIQVYTYAGPRVGDPTFMQFYDQLVPRTYRIVNLADMITIVPPQSFDQKEYLHVGQEWSYLSQLGSIANNHAISTYRTAVDAGVEINQTRRYPTSGL